MEFKGLKPILYGGREVWPLIEGGKGVSATNHMSSGAWAAAGGIGTVSAVNADSYDAEGKIIPQIYDQLTRLERHEQLIRYASGSVARSSAPTTSPAAGRVNITAVKWAATRSAQAGSRRPSLVAASLRRGMPYS